MNKISIIIPCYNCARTLKESVLSCFEQGLESFEIVMVNDASTDGTKDLMESLAEDHSEIHVFHHDQNKGGGATRNAAVSHTSGEIIFCLDSDDILPPNTLSKMVATMEEKRCDGVVFESGHSFSAMIENVKPYSYNDNTAHPVAVEEFFAGLSTGVTANFLYTKSAFEAAGGYPVHHNFDTQGFGVRFLAAGLKAYTCPASFFYHRQFTDTFSYFERSYNSGELSLNYFLILLDAFHLLSEEIRAKILAFDIFGNNRMNSRDLFSMIKELYILQPSTFFIPEYRQYLSMNGVEQFIQAHPDDAMVKMNHLLRKNKYREAMQILAPSSPAAQFLISYFETCADTEDKRISQTNSPLLKPLYSGSKRPGLLGRILNKGMRILRNMIK